MVFLQNKNNWHIYTTFGLETECTAYIQIACESFKNCCLSGSDLRDYWTSALTETVTLILCSFFVFKIGGKSISDCYLQVLPHVESPAIACFLPSWLPLTTMVVQLCVLDILLNNSNLPFSHHNFSLHFFLFWFV